MNRTHRQARLRHSDNFPGFTYIVEPVRCTPYVRSTSIYNTGPTPARTVNLSSKRSQGKVSCNLPLNHTSYHLTYLPKLMNVSSHLTASASQEYDAQHSAHSRLNLNTESDHQQHSLRSADDSIYKYFIFLTPVPFADTESTIAPILLR